MSHRPEHGQLTPTCGEATVHVGMCGGVAWGSDNAIVRETCGRVIGGDFVLGLAVMQGARLLGLPVTQPCGDWVIFVLLGGGGSFGNRVSGYSEAAGIGIQSKG